MIHLWGIWELGSLQLNRLLETLDQGRQTLSVEPVGRASCPQTLWQAIASNTCWICEKKVLLGEQDKFLSWADSGKPTMETMPSEWVTNNSFKFQVQVTLNSLASPCPMPSPDLLSYLPIMLAWFLPLHLFLGLISSEGTFQDSPPLLTLLSQASPWSPCWTFSSTIWLNRFPASASKWSSVHTPMTWWGHILPSLPVSKATVPSTDLSHSSVLHKCPLPPVAHGVSLASGPLCYTTVLKTWQTEITRGSSWDAVY